MLYKHRIARKNRSYRKKDHIAMVFAPKQEKFTLTYILSFLMLRKGHEIAIIQRDHFLRTIHRLDRILRVHSF